MDDRTHPRRTILGAVALALATMACRSGLTTGEWTWCKVHLSAVDAAAETLGQATAPMTFQEPSWWTDFVTGNANASLAWVANSPAFTNACFAAAATKGVVEDGRVPWCLEDGLGETWDASIAQGSMVEVKQTTFAYRGLPLQQRLDNEDFANACRAAFTAR